MISDKTLRYIKKHLPSGWVSLIQEATGYSKASVSRVLNGDYYNEVIIDEAIKLSRQNKKQQEQMNNKIKKIIDDDHF